MEFWEKQIQRADELAAQSVGSNEMLAFYSRLLRAQKEIYEKLRSLKNWLPTGNLKNDLPGIDNVMGSLIRTVALHGPATLSTEAQSLLKSEPTAIGEMLIDYWRNRLDIQFFPKAILQPYARWLIETGARPVDRELPAGERSCPFCGGNPQVSFLQSKESTAESGNRDLICATCLHSWEFRRVVCAGCGEERPAKLGYFHSPEFDHIRIEACDTCKRYIKGIDLTRVGFAAPLVDEMYGAPLDLWAHEHGYAKIELNLVGL